MNHSPFPIPHSLFPIPSSPHSRCGFTLVELLVVIGIIAVLAGTLMVAGSGSTEKARMAKCAANLRNLAAAAHSYAAGSGRFPFAQSVLTASTDRSRNGRGLNYSPRKGWLSFLDRGVSYPVKSPTSASQCSFASSDDNVTYAITNGAIWQAIGGNRSCYVCPSFLEACRKAGTKNPGWSYQMSAYYGYNNGKPTMSLGIEPFKMKRADRYLLFAEIPCIDADHKKPGDPNLPPVSLTGGDGNEACDGCLRYKSKGGNESIGFNHRSGKKLVGHVVFADGHEEALYAPKDGNFVELTDWLCCGKDVVFRNDSYEEIKDAVE